MTKTELSLCQTGISEYVTDASTADFIQDLALRLRSAASVMETAIQECVSIFDEMEQIANEKALAVGNNTMSVQFSPKVAEGSQFASSLADLLSAALLEGAQRIRQKGVAWYAEEEPVTASIDGEEIQCWHMSNNGEIAVICTEYLGGPRMEVPLSALSRIEE